MDDCGVARCRVLLSYAHETPDHVALVERFCRFLRENAVDARLDLYASEERQDWVDWCSREIALAERVLVVVSPGYLRKFDQTAPVVEGTGVQVEGALIRNEFARDPAAARVKFLPVLLPGTTVQDIPAILQPNAATSYQVHDFTVAGAERLLRLLTKQPGWIKPDLGPVPHLPPLSANLAVVLRLAVSGGDAASRDAVVQGAVDPLRGCGATVQVQPDDGAVSEALVVADPDDRQEGVAAGLRALHERVRVAGGKQIRARIGADLARQGSDRIDKVAQRLVWCMAGRTMHDVPGADVVIVASGAFHAHVADGRGHFPAVSTYAPWPEVDPGGPTCWISVPGRARCPRMPERPRERADTDPAVPRGWVHVEQRYGGSVHIGDVHHHGPR